MLRHGKRELCELFGLFSFVSFLVCYFLVSCLHISNTKILEQTEEGSIIVE